MLGRQSAQWVGKTLQERVPTLWPARVVQQVMIELGWELCDIDPQVFAGQQGLLTVADWLCELLPAATQTIQLSAHLRRGHQSCPVKASRPSLQKCGESPRRDVGFERRRTETYGEHHGKNVDLGPKHHADL